MSEVTIKSIAKALNLSPATISRALNDSHEIKQATKDRVLAYAKAHNYRPNPFAKNLKTGKTNLIGVVIPFLSSPFFLEFIEELYRAVMPLHYTLIPFQTQNQETLEKEALDFLTQQNVAGIIISPAHENSNATFLEKIHNDTCPVILFDRIQHGLKTHKIGIHNSMETYKATEELINKGRKKIAFLCGKDIGNTKDRIRGYKNALHNNSIPFTEDYIIYADYQDPNQDIDEELRSTLSALQDRNLLPDAIVGGTDTLSIKILGILADLKLHIPEDVAVIGFTNTNLADYLQPALSTIKQPTQKMANLAVELLMELIAKVGKRNDMDYQSFLLPSQTFYRKSTDI
ncbi:LacI family DNA-binding transcriptional regulator [Sphingobacterium deserti]|uniref:Periplasmic binding protein/LacI transcriptional regulator n=1 Tax=Sphingobacterium deserti TaxID=1229276 RepID=A0A0B8T7M7_9SPHI|nr:LacI family DNA-binding transcriptional regulator [Sphingobacterium deserti]KGE13745.1 periplasmic binding protein/LacI transcriptional regulator [Sphingobacterium deserti]